MVSKTTHLETIALRRAKREGEGRGEGSAAPKVREPVWLCEVPSEASHQKHELMCEDHTCPQMPAYGGCWDPSLRVLGI